MSKDPDINVSDAYAEIRKVMLSSEVLRFIEFAVVNTEKNGLNIKCSAISNMTDGANDSPLRDIILRGVPHAQPQSLDDSLTELKRIPGTCSARPLTESSGVIHDYKHSPSINDATILSRLPAAMHPIIEKQLKLVGNTNTKVSGTALMYELASGDPCRIEMHEWSYTVSRESKSLFGWFTSWVLEFRTRCACLNMDSSTISQHHRKLELFDTLAQRRVGLQEYLANLEKNEKKADASITTTTTTPPDSGMKADPVTQFRQIMKHRERIRMTMLVQKRPDVSIRITRDFRLVVVASSEDEKVAIQRYLPEVLSATTFEGLPPVVDVELAYFHEE